MLPQLTPCLSPVLLLQPALLWPGIAIDLSKLWLCFRSSTISQIHLLILVFQVSIYCGSLYILWKSNFYLSHTTRDFTTCVSYKQTDCYLAGIAPYIDDMIVLLAIPDPGMHWFLLLSSYLRWLYFVQEINRLFFKNPSIFQSYNSTTT